MLTKWAKRALKVHKASGYILPDIATSGKSFYEVKGCKGTTKYAGPYAGGPDFTLIAKPLSDFVERGSSFTKGLAFGTGTTAPTEDDYTIENIISSGLSISATPVKNYLYDTENGTVTAFYDITLANSTASDISITEICQFGNITCADELNVDINSYVGNNFSVLINRNVLDTPFVVPAGGSNVLRYSITY